MRPSPDLSDFGLPLDEHGRVTVDPTLQVTGTSDVWALGDCAAVPNTRTPDRFDPPTCQHALRQARRLAKNLKGPPRPYGYRMLGQVATLGRYRGIAELPGLRLRGFLGWFVARTYHLYALPTFRRKMRVVDRLDRGAVLPARHRGAVGARTPARARAVVGAQRSDRIAVPSD